MLMPRDEAAGRAGNPGTDQAQPYAYYALAVLTAASLLNFLDRLIVSILAQSIKADLQLTDAELGFLLGTGFAVFYAVVGIAMGRICDVVPRTRMMALGLTVWSAMTAFGAGATNFAQLGMARIGVGVGEATANPASHSLITDYFPARNRAAALGTYVAGSFLGGATAMVLGGYIVQHWSSGLCQAIPGAFACGLKGWQAALIIVGLPGLPVALLVAGLREPARPGKESVPLGRLLLREFSAAIPPFTLILLARADRRAFRANVALVAGLLALGWTLVRLTGDAAQWWAITLGAYAVISWGQVQKVRDRPFYALTFGCPTFVLSMLGAALVACTTGAVNAWAAPYAMRVLHMSPAGAGGALGLVFAISAGVGVVVSGYVTDRWKPRDVRAPLFMAMLSLTGSIPMLGLMTSATAPALYLVAYCLFAICTAGWAAGIAALIQDLVLPRMRGGAASAFALVNVVVAAGAGPYWVGKVSTVTGSLAKGMWSVQLLAPFSLALLLLAARRLVHETPAGRSARADAAGEIVRAADIRTATQTS